MAEAVLRIRAEGGRETAAALGAIHGKVRSVYQAMSAEARALAKRMAQANAEAFNLQQKAIDLACKKATEAQRKLAAESKRAAAQTAAANQAAAAAIRRSASSEFAWRRRANERSVAEERRELDRGVREFQRAERRKTAALQAEVGRRGRMTRGGSSRDSGAEERDRSPRRRSGRGGGSTSMDVLERSVTFFAGYGDDIRESQRARNELEHRAQVLASNELRDPNARAQVMGVVQAENLRTGVDPTEILSAIERAQAGFSALGTSADRAVYLGQVLPMLTSAAVATGTKLEDMVDAAGEFQRQMNISSADMPRAIAGAIAQGRLGSISFKDQARHMGVLAGGGARYLSTTGPNSMVSNALVGALFQTAGQAGGGGDVAATRARAFQDNFTSDRGRNRLRGLIGYNAFDERGQLRAREGETQADAFARVSEDAFRASGGNATRFGVAMGGANTRSRALTDQLFRDLSAHQGRLTTFRGLVSAGMTATRADTDAAARDALNTPLSQDAQRNARAFWQRADPRQSFAMENQRAIDELKARSPLLGKIAENPLTMGMMDLLGTIQQNLGPSPSAGPTGGPARTRRELYRQQAENEVNQRYNGWRDSGNPLMWLAGSAAEAVGGEGRRREATQEINARVQELVANAQSRGINVDRPLRIAPGSSVSLDPATVRDIGNAVANAGGGSGSAQDRAFNAARAATGAVPVPPEYRQR